MLVKKVIILLNTYKILNKKLNKKLYKYKKYFY